MIVTATLDRHTFSARIGAWEVFITRKSWPAFISIAADGAAFGSGTDRDGAGKLREATLEVPFFALSLVNHRANAPA